MLKILAVAMVGAIGLAGAGLADETWNSEIGGTIVWESDVDGISVFSYNSLMGGGARAHLYLPGLVDSIEDRGVYFGHWIDPAGGGCGAMLTGVDGMSSDGWGAAIIKFDRSAFPTGWTALLGDCMETPYIGLRADVP